MRTKTSYKSLNRVRPPAARLILKRQLVDFLGGKCVDCGYSEHLAAIDFDHIEPSTKMTTVSKLLNNAPEELVWIEAKKCELRCANCHRIKTHPDAHIEKDDEIFKKYLTN